MAITKNEKGMVFAADFLIAAILLFACALLIFSHVNGIAQKIAANQKKSSLASNGIFLMDSLVKNSDKNNPLLGSAYFNPQLKRVEQNTIDFELLKKAAPQKFGDFFAKSISFAKKGKELQKIFDQNATGECIGIERFVIIKEILGEEKAKITGVVCSG